MDDDRPELASDHYWIGRFDGLITGGFWGFVAGVLTTSIVLRLLRLE
jgi:hypothetical protein